MENNQSIENEQPQERSRESILAELRNQLRVDHDYLTKNDEILDCNLEELKERYKARNDIIEAYIENNKQIGNKENESENLLKLRADCQEKIMRLLREIDQQKKHLGLKRLNSALN